MTLRSRLGGCSDDATPQCHCASSAPRRASQTVTPAMSHLQSVPVARDISATRRRSTVQQSGASEHLFAKEGAVTRRELETFLCTVSEILSVLADDSL